MAKEIKFNMDARDLLKKRRGRTGRCCESNIGPQRP